MVNPSNPLNYWALHVTHVLVSLIGIGGLLGFTYFSEVIAKIPLSGTDIAAVWVVGLPLFGYFISKIDVNAQGISEATTAQTNTAQS